MSNMLTSILAIHGDMPDATRRLCEQFLAGQRPRFVYGCNAWARSIAEHVPIEAYVDDFRRDPTFHGQPVVRSDTIPSNSIVISSVVGERPITALTHIRCRVESAVDYFAFHKCSGLPLKNVLFLGDVEVDFESHADRLENVYRRLADEESRRVFRCLMNFRLSHDLAHMHGFVDAQFRQYFEPFLRLNRDGETFVDVGCYDGYTTEEFIVRCPSFAAAHVFEPEAANMDKVRARLGGKARVAYHAVGAWDRPEVLRFQASGSSSSIGEVGDVEIQAGRIDDEIKGPITFLKMDIEGAEMRALAGAAGSIREFHPRLAICVYHKVDDLWRIPEFVLSIRDDYELFLRHYTEGITETVMFFIPRK